MDITLVEQLYKLLNTAGAWGMCALLIVAVVMLFRRLEAKDKLLLDEVRACKAEMKELLIQQSEDTRAMAEIVDTLKNVVKHDR